MRGCSFSHLYNTLGDVDALIEGIGHAKRTMRRLERARWTICIARKFAITTSTRIIYGYEVWHPEGTVVSPLDSSSGDPVIRVSPANDQTGKPDPGGQPDPACGR